MKDMVNLKIFDSVEEIADYTFKLLAETAEQKSSGSAALSFGSTYEGIFPKWRMRWEISGRPDLPAFFPADERLVAFSDKDSNWRTACESFLSECGTTADPERWASDIKTYRKIITDYFGAAVPVFDLIFLGIGPDGHTASLFPDKCPAEGTPEWNEIILKTTAPFTPKNRLTLGPEVIASAGKLIITVTGGGKAAIFAELYKQLYGEAEPSLPPAKIVKRRERLGFDTTILCDNQAMKNTALN